MAKAGAKKRLEDNAKRLALLQTVIAVANALHLVINFGLFRAYRSSAAWAGLALTSALYAFAYTSLAAVARPVYGDGGALVDGGGDLNLGGVTSYYHDLIWLSAAVQLGSLVTRRAWWLFLVVPLFLLWLLWTNVLQPRFAAGKVQAMDSRQETPAERKKREKLERKSTRGVRYR